MRARLYNYLNRLGLVVRRSAGKAAEERRLDSPLRFIFLFAIYGHSLVTLPCTINETVKWLTSLAPLNVEVILVVTV